MAVGAGDVHAVVVDRVARIKEETDITNDIINSHALYNPQVAKMILREFRSKETFKTQVGLNFLASLERVIKNDKKEKVTVVLVATVLLLALAFAVVLAAGLIVLPKILALL